MGTAWGSRGKNDPSAQTGLTCASAGCTTCIVGAMTARTSRPRRSRRAVPTVLGAMCIVLALLFAFRPLAGPSGYVSPDSCAHPTKCALPAWISPAILIARAVPERTGGTDLILTVRLKVTRPKFVAGGELAVVTTTGASISPVVDSTITFSSGMPAARSCSQLPSPGGPRILPGANQGSYPRFALGTHGPVTDCFAIGALPATAVKVIWSETLIVAGSSPPHNDLAHYYSGPSFESFSRVLSIRYALDAPKA